MLNSADLVAILSLSSFIIFPSSSSACSDNVSGLDAACGPIRSLLIALAALRRIVRLVCACLHPIRFERNSPLPHRPRLATNGHTIYDSSTQVAPMPHIEIRNVSVVDDRDVADFDVRHRGDLRAAVIDGMPIRGQTRPMRQRRVSLESNWV